MLTFVSFWREVQQFDRWLMLFKWLNDKERVISPFCQMPFSFVTLNFGSKFKKSCFPIFLLRSVMEESWWFESWMFEVENSNIKKQKLQKNIIFKKFSRSKACEIILEFITIFYPFDLHRSEIKTKTKKFAIHRPKLIIILQQYYSTGVEWFQTFQTLFFIFCFFFAIFLLFFEFEVLISNIQLSNHQNSSMCVNLIL